MTNLIKIGDLVIFKPSLKIGWMAAISCGQLSETLTSKTPPMIYLGKKVVAKWGENGKKYKYHHLLHDGKVFLMRARGRTAHAKDCFTAIKQEEV